MYIGIDVGITSTAVILICIKSEIHNEDSTQPNGHAEQSVSLHKRH